MEILLLKQLMIDNNNDDYEERQWIKNNCWDVKKSRKDEGKTVKIKLN